MNALSTERKLHSIRFTNFAAPDRISVCALEPFSLTKKLYKLFSFNVHYLMLTFCLLYYCKMLRNKAAA